MSNNYFIDFAKYKNSDTDALTQALSSALMHHNIAILINHSIPKKCIKDAFQASRDFHASSMEEKMKIYAGESFHGYIPSRQSPKFLNEADSFMLFNEPHTETSHLEIFQSENRWPASLPQFKSQVKNYQKEIKALSASLLPCFASILNIEVAALENYFKPSSNYLRLFNYKPLPNNQFSFKPHEDFGFVSYIIEDSPGFYINDQGENLHLLDIPENAIVLLPGKVLEYMSSGRIKAAPHAVKNNTGHNRASICYFFDPRLDFLIPNHPENLDYAEHLKRSVCKDYISESCI